MMGIFTCAWFEAFFLNVYFMCMKEGSFGVYFFVKVISSPSFPTLSYHHHQMTPVISSHISDILPMKKLSSSFSSLHQHFMASANSLKQSCCTKILLSRIIRTQNSLKTLAVIEVFSALNIFGWSSVIKAANLASIIFAFNSIYLVFVFLFEVKCFYD